MVTRRVTGPRLGIKELLGLEGSAIFIIIRANYPKRVTYCGHSFIRKPEGRPQLPLQTMDRPQALHLP